MKSTKNTLHIQRAASKLLKQYPVVAQIAQLISQEGGRSFLVGGAVRDLILKLPVKDVDIEVHGLSLEKLHVLLKRFGPLRLVGKVFGVLRIDGVDIDWSVPRADSGGRKPRVKIDPHMPLKQAFERRDLTINAMGIDIETSELVDPFGGCLDLKAKRLKAPNALFFKEDPLRLFRVMQFISRFDFKPDMQLNRICAQMDIKKVSKERIEKEFEKMLLKSKRPSLGLRWLKKIGRLKEIFPELAATSGVVQDSVWHPEGDVFEHTMQALDAAAALPIKDQDERLLIMYAALCHDLGKVKTTEKRGNKITSYHHEVAGVPLAKSLLKRITNNKELIESVAKLVRYHMAPLQLAAQKAKSPAYKRLANKAAPHITLQLLAYLSLADRQGRNGRSANPLTKKVWKDLEAFKRKARTLKVYTQHEKPILQGRDLVKNVDPGPKMGRLLAKAYSIQIEEGVQDKRVLKKRVLDN